VRRTDEQRLRLFCDRVDYAISLRAVRDGTITSGFQLSFSSEDGVRLEADLGDNDDTRSLVVEIRKFLMDREDVHFFGIANIVERTVKDAELHDANRKNRESWMRELRGADIGIHADGVHYAPERCFDLVVNGDMFHDDAAKAAEFARLDPMLQLLARRNMHRLVIRALTIHQLERNLINEAFERGAIAA